MELCVAVGLRMVGEVNRYHIKTYTILILIFCLHMRVLRDLTTS